MLLVEQLGSLAVRQGRMIFELLPECVLLFWSEFGGSSFAGSGVEVSLFALELEVTPDGAGVDVVALSDVGDVLALVDGGGDALSEVGGVGFHGSAYSTGNYTEQGFRTTLDVSAFIRRWSRSYATPRQPISSGSGPNTNTKNTKLTTANGSVRLAV
jgi:hypothetical protein